MLLDRRARPYPRRVDLAAYLSTVVAVCGLAVGAMYLIVNLLGKRFDDVNKRFDDVNNRFDHVHRRFDAVDHRLDRLETQNDSIIGAVSDLGQRVTRLEMRNAT